VRTPGYLFGASGVIERYCGVYSDPSLLAFGVDSGPPQHLYRVRFEQHALWLPVGVIAPQHTVDVEIYECWLEPAPDMVSSLRPCSFASAFADGDDHQHHDHDHHHGHVHHTRFEVETMAASKEVPPCNGQAIFEALQELCLQKGLVTRARMQAVIDKLESAGRELHGARLVARAWLDADFKVCISTLVFFLVRSLISLFCFYLQARLLADAPQAARELGIETSNPNAPTHLTVMANDDHTHNLIVCTMCSCYPAAILGPSPGIICKQLFCLYVCIHYLFCSGCFPAWYKSRAYRARGVRQPRELLRDAFGLEIAPDVHLRVHDSTADLRYMVLPRRPAGTDGWDEAALAAIVTRDALLGVAEVHMAMV
jgi:nitrile hydratase